MDLDERKDRSAIPDVVFARDYGSRHISFYELKGYLGRLHIYGQAPKGEVGHELGVQRFQRWIGSLVCDGRPANHNNTHP